jgi:L-lactate dehydrogenase complex protein LldG
VEGAPARRERAVTDAREHVLGAIRAALGREALDAEARTRLEARLASPAANLLPHSAEDVVALFVRNAAAQAMSLARLGSLDAVPEAVAAYIADHRLAARAVVAPALRALAWPAHLELRTGPAGQDDLLSVTPCFAAVAETGSVALISGPESPTTLNFVPDDHLVVVETARIVRYQEEVWARLRRDFDSLPRTVNLISGPSRTADIEQVLQLGVHGPRRVHLLLVGG